MNDAEIHALVTGAAAAASVAAYPCPDDRVLIAARDESGVVIASFTVTSGTARRFADGTLGAAIILNTALNEFLADSADD